MGVLRTWAVVFGIAFIGVGILGFYPRAMPDGLLLGFFQVDPIHNLVHIVSGAIALFAATKVSFAKFYFQIFGLVYTLVAILGFAMDGNLILMHVNMADNYLHLGIGLLSLYLGFVWGRRFV